MRKVKLKMPSPTAVVSLLAIVVALPGSAIAAGLVGGEDVRNDSLTGADVRESTLATVPAARSVGGRSASDLASQIELRAATQGPFVTIGSFQNLGDVSELRVGPFTLRSTCEQSGSNNNERSRTIVETSEDGAYMLGSSPRLGPGFGSGRLNRDTPESGRTLSDITVPVAGKDGVVPSVGGGWLLGRDGTHVAFMGSTRITGFNEFGARCFSMGRAWVDDYIS